MVQGKSLRRSNTGRPLRVTPVQVLQVLEIPCNRQTYQNNSKYASLYDNSVITNVTLCKYETSRSVLPMAERFSGHPQARKPSRMSRSSASLGHRWASRHPRAVGIGTPNPFSWALGQRIPTIPTGQGIPPAQTAWRTKWEIHRYMLQICRLMAIGRAWTRDNKSSHLQ